jgi:type IV pilus assembly protein PilE
MKKISGFTLIEIMVVVLIVGILAGIGYPAYMNYVDRSKIVDGKTLLLENAQILEREYAVNNIYTNATLTGSRGDVTLTSTLNAHTFTINASMDLHSENECSTISLNEKGQRTPAGCWD